MLDRYTSYLDMRGVFIARMYGGSETYGAIVETISTHFTVVETYLSDAPKAIVLVFRKT